MQASLTTSIFLAGHCVLVIRPFWCLDNIYQ